MQFRVEDMSCGHCTAAIETAIRDAGGSAKTDLPNKTVTIADMDRARAMDAIRGAGYTPVPLD